MQTKLSFVEVCPQIVQINAFDFDATVQFLACPICGTKIIEEHVTDEFCEHVLFIGTLGTGIIKYNPASGLDDTPSIDCMELNAETFQKFIEGLQEDQKAVAFYRNFAKNCVIFCYRNYDVSDCMAVRFPSDHNLPTMGDWLAQNSEGN